MSSGGPHCWVNGWPDRCDTGRVIAGLLDELAHAIPDLHGAACAGRPELFDVDRDDPRVEEAKALCSGCPVLRDCRRWLAGLPWYRRPCGVVAGRYVPPPRLRPAYEPRPAGTRPWFVSSSSTAPTQKPGRRAA